MKIDKSIGAFLPSLKALGAALALACAAQSSVAAVATANLGGFAHASAVVSGGGVINFLDRFQSYSTFATNGPVTQSSEPFSFDWGSAAPLSQANPGGNVARAGNVNGAGGSDDPFNPIDSTGVSADATVSTVFGSKASGSAFKEGQFNLVSSLDFITPVAGGIDFIFDYSLSTAAAGADNAEAFVLVTFDNVSNALLPSVFFEQLLAAGTRTGTFTYHLDLGAGDIGYLSMAAGAQVAAIPEPSMLLLLGPGLLGIAMVRRRRQKQGAAAAA
ncbi:MAG: PEP-CTERM sorting domain-containing protein [Gemmatimonadaceae bacterium]|nr:PEP-CTERM sorting domain-containing protein [Acetobacteraceae bacterium]